MRRERVLNNQIVVTIINMSFLYLMLFLAAINVKEKDYAWAVWCFGLFLIFLIKVYV